LGAIDRPAVSEMIALVDWTGMWQSTQLFAIFAPMVLNIPQPSAR
jgi:hypothetical protein